MKNLCILSSVALISFPHHSVNRKYISDDIFGEPDVLHALAWDWPHLCWCATYLTLQGNIEYKTQHELHFTGVTHHP